MGRQKKKKARKLPRMLMAKTPVSSVHILLLQGQILIQSIHAKWLTKRLFSASAPALITAYMGLAWGGGGIEQGVFTLNSFMKLGYFFIFFLALVPVCLCKH